jgi:cytochrome P450
LFHKQLDQLQTFSKKLNKGIVVQDYTAKVGTFLPFGAGSRLCPGADLVKLEICVFLHYFLFNYRLALLIFYSQNYQFF